MSDSAADRLILVRDGVVRGSERCDGNNLDSQTCSTLGYYSGGDVSCASDCLFDTSTCGGGVTPGTR